MKWGRLPGIFFFLNRPSKYIYYGFQLDLSFLVHSSIVPHLFLIFSSFLPHSFLICSTFDPHMFLIFSSYFSHLFLICSSLVPHSFLIRFSLFLICASFVPFSFVSFLFRPFQSFVITIIFNDFYRLSLMRLKN